MLLCVESWMEIVNLSPNNYLNNNSWLKNAWIKKKCNNRQISHYYYERCYTVEMNSTRVEKDVLLSCPCSLTGGKLVLQVTDQHNVVLSDPARWHDFVSKISKFLEDFCVQI